MGLSTQDKASLVFIYQIYYCMESVWNDISSVLVVLYILKSILRIDIGL